MAITMRESVEINRPIEEVFAYLRDVSNDAKWQKSVVEAKVTSEGPMRVGSTGVHRVKLMGMSDEYGWEVVEYEEPRRGAWKFTSGPMTGTGGYTLDSRPGGTTVTFSADFQARGLRRLLEPLMRGMFAKETRRDLGNLKTILESGS